MRDSYQIFSLKKGEFVTPLWTDTHFFYPHPYDEEKERLVTLSGTYFLLKRRCLIGIWEISSGRWIGACGPGPQYGGGGNLYGLASHPEERFIISSDDLGRILVWDIEKNLESWIIQGLPRMRVKLFAFLWGGYLVAALTEANVIHIFRFWWQSEIVGSIPITEPVKEIYSEPYGDRIFVLYDSGHLECYRYNPNQHGDATDIEGNRLHVRFRSRESKMVQVAGTFNNWNPTGTDLVCIDGNLWEGIFELPEGRTEFKLVIDGTRWELDQNIPFIPGVYGPNNYVDILRG